MPSLLWGIDLGGTKIEGVVVDRADPTAPICRMRVDTEAAHGYKHILQRIEMLVSQMTAEVGEGPRALGIGAPGAIRPGSGVMMNANTTCLNGKPLQGDLISALEIPCRITNDANCFALAEALHGAAQGQKVVFGSITGTGVGGGIVVNGEVWAGRQGIAGEWGHMILEQDGHPCYCGRRGCVETVLSGPALERHYQSLTGKALKLHKIVEAVKTDDAAAATLERLYTMFGRAIAQVINLLDPDVVVLGGGVGNVPGLDVRGLEEARKWVFQPSPDLSFVKPELGDSAGVFGAAMLFEGSSLP